MSAAEDDIRPEILDALVDSLPSAPDPTPSLRQRLLGRVSSADRFLPFLDRVARMFDLGEDRAQAELDTIDRGDDWEDMLPGIRFRDFEGGPALGEAHGGLVRVAPGCTFPRHAHVGTETVMILQGRMRDDRGREYRAGDVIVSDDGTDHEFVAIGDKEVIYAAAVIALQFIGGDEDDDGWEG
jgi:quercetin dioxygenase-like cupin family protein